MDPLSALGISPTPAIQVAFLKAGLPAQELAILLSLVGQDLDLVLLESTPEGARLQLPEGQVVTAQGELPFPEGTHLRVRISATGSGEPALRLQTLEARPPAPPAVLAPLLQGEAAPLMARLQANAAELDALVRLLEVLAGPIPQPSAEPAVASAPPSSLEVQAAVAALPASLQAGLARVAGLPSAAPAAEVAKVLTAWIAQAWSDRAAAATRPMPPAALRAYGAAPATPRTPEPSRTIPAEPATAPASQPAPGPAASRKLPEGEAIPGPPVLPGTPDRAQAVLQLFQQQLARMPDLPIPQRDALGTWIRQLLGKALGRSGAASPEAGPAAPRTAPGPALPPASPRTGTSLARATEQLQQALEARPGPAARLPESWETWIRGTTQTLADPAVSPREAPFHALQSLERTSFFELPLPWTPQPLHLWVEGDAPERDADPREQVTRILLGTSFSRLGETRIGLEKGPRSLRARIWVQHPGLLEGTQDSLLAELQGLGGTVDLRILGLEPGPVRSLRSVVAGSSLNALS